MSSQMCYGLTIAQTKTMAYNYALFYKKKERKRKKKEKKLSFPIKQLSKDCLLTTANQEIYYYMLKVIYLW